MAESMNKKGTGKTGQRRCPLCGGLFVCGMEAGQKKCWCAELPPVRTPDVTPAGCYCPDCLQKMPVKTVFSR